jgi:hypothetical protein
VLPQLPRASRLRTNGISERRVATPGLALILSRDVSHVCSSNIATPHLGVDVADDVPPLLQLLQELDLLDEALPGLGVGARQVDTLQGELVPVWADDLQSRKSRALDEVHEGCSLDELNLVLQPELQD